MQILGHLVGTAVFPHVLPHHADVRVAGHFLVDGLAQGVEEKGFGHGASAGWRPTYLSLPQRRC